MAGTTGTARQEAERLVATVLAMAAQSGLGGGPRDRSDPEAGPSGVGDMLSGLVDQFMGGSSSSPPSAGGHGGTGRAGWSTGSAECCVCPICRAIANLRNPSPEQAERLATGAGDFASGVASLLRAFSVMSGTTGKPTRPQQPSRPTTTPDQAWSAATRTTKPADLIPPDHQIPDDANPWTAATRTPRPAPPEPAAAAPSEPDQEAMRAAAPTASGRAAAPADATAEAAAAQAAAQTDATGPGVPAESSGAARPADPRDAGDPWSAATRIPSGSTSRTTPDQAATGEGPAVRDQLGDLASTFGDFAARLGREWKGATADPTRATRPSRETPGADAGQTTRPATEAAGVDAGQADPADDAGPGGRDQVGDFASALGDFAARVGREWTTATSAASRPPVRSTDPTTSATATPARTGEADRAGFSVTAAGEAAVSGSRHEAAAGEGARGGAERDRIGGLEAHQDVAAAVDGPGARTGEESPATDEAARVTGVIEDEPVAMSTNPDTAGDTGVADTASVDHDVPGTAPAASVAEGRVGGVGDGARSGDAV